MSDRVRGVVVTLVAGLVAGTIVGGLGARLLMRIVAAANKGLKGTTTDAGANVGEISVVGTLELLLNAGVLGLITGVIYLVVRLLLPPERPARALLFALFMGLLGLGAAISGNPNDFERMRPLGILVVGFFAVPFAVGFALSWMSERASSKGRHPDGGTLPRYELRYLTFGALIALLVIFDARLIGRI